MIPGPDVVGWELERAHQALRARGLTAQVEITAAPPRRSARAHPSGPLRVVRQRWEGSIALLVCARSVVLAADEHP